MEFCSADSSLVHWESMLAAGGAVETTQERLLLAWSLRQRDTRRALAYAMDVEGLLDSTDWPAAEISRTRARLSLLRAEAHLLLGQMDQAATQLAQARGLFESLSDSLGLADLHWLAHYLAADLGDSTGLRAELSLAIDWAERGGDGQRSLLFQANLARAEIFVDQAAAESHWLKYLPAEGQAQSAMAEAALADFRGLLAAMTGQLLHSIKAWSEAFELAMQTGQIRRAITLATNLGHTYTKMSDFQTAMEWLKRGLDLSRSARWPSMISLCLAHTGEALRHLEQLNDARDLLVECLALTGAQPSSRTHALALSYLGHTELDSGQAAAAQQAFTALMQAGIAVCSLDLQINARLGLARAALMQAQFALACEQAELGLQLARAQHEPSAELDLLWVLADIQRDEGASIAELEPHRKTLAWYELALQRASTMEGFTPPPKLLDAAAKAYARVGDFERAYLHSLRASEGRQRSFNEEAAKRSSALQAHHQIERARAESEHLRRLAESEAARFQLLHDSHEVLLHLGQIGQEITNELVAERIFEVMERHIHALLDAPCMAIYLLDAKGQQLNCAFGMEDGVGFVDPPIPMSSPRSLTVRCVNERKEFLFGDASSAGLGEQVPGTSSQQSVIFVPLQVGERVTGVMTIQSPRVGAFGERQQIIFRSLCSYIAIALDNAAAYQRLSDLQKQLMAQEKLAALGSMVAGVAHELNTPIGNSLLIASTLLDATQDFSRQVEQQALKRSEWQQYASRAVDGLAVINRSMESAAALVRSFKQVAVDRSSEQRRRFDLAELCEQCGQTMAMQISRAGRQLQLNVPAGMQLDSYPGALSQVLIILISNALLHAFEGRVGGRIELGAEAAEDGRFDLWVRDDGVGMSPAMLERVFDPFFTTKFGQGGSGLGLSIGHNLVTHVLGGSLGVSSQEGVGSCFRLGLPRAAP
ncbi:sensor histidine kinase [Roseateles oligotrophus]|uniref:histidine kinase n=1 Tax=Roseateles oligotrophus TaxID=1769250 RepID=A0ABT2YJY7_9BURK|nr:GAF domain-containing sensor histidine kinase [Roseateles oligotrophus]MCV2370317.1 GAF domain-containing sensor histidine kinase [Roseateles oligotrophus]